jgi:GTPase SAR1 family protein
MYLRDADVVLLVFDRAAPQTFDSVREWFGVIRETADPKIVLVANKCDLPCAVDEGAIQALSEELHFAATFFTSAKSGAGIDALFLWIFQTLGAVDAPNVPKWRLPDPVDAPPKTRCEGNCIL